MGHLGSDGKPFPAEEQAQLATALLNLNRQLPLYHPHDLNVPLLCEWHALLSAGLPRMQGGQLRSQDITFGSFFGTAPDHIASELDALVVQHQQTWSSAFLQDEALAHATWVHAELLRIHPFWDGNGRLARAVQAWLCGAGESQVPVYLARYLRDGTPDPAFGNNGYVTYADRSAEDTDGVYGRAVHALPDGRIMTAATISRTDQDSFQTEGAIRLARYLPDGARDPEFGEDGQTLTDFGYSAFANEMRKVPGGYLLTGSVQSDASSSPASSLLRMTEEGEPDTSFNFDGRVGVGNLSDTFGMALLKGG